MPENNFIGPAIGPGGRTSRRVTDKGEVWRILATSWWMSLFGVLTLALFLPVLYLWGPWLGWGIGGIALLVLYRTCVYRNVHRGVALGILLALLIFWALIIGPICNSWPVPLCVWNPWWKIAVTVPCLLIQAVLIFGIRALFIEQVDPEGPTPTRKAIYRDKPIMPWDEETYGGMTDDYIPPTPLPPPERLLRIRVESREGKSSHDITIPDTPQWKTFATAMTASPPTAGFTEGDARRFQVKLDDVHNNGYSVPGMRTIRAQMLELGWMEWKNPAHHNLGLIMHTPAMQILEAVAGREPVEIDTD